MIIKLALATALVGCGKSEVKVYEISAVEAVGVQPDADGPIIENARQRLPAILQKCGVDIFRHVEATDSAIIFRFQVASSEDDRLQCISQASPDGVDVRETLVGTDV